jgi:hypothetical protein
MTVYVLIDTESPNGNPVYGVYDNLRTAYLELFDGNHQFQAKTIKSMIEDIEGYSQYLVFKKEITK